MLIKSDYESPLGNLLLLSDGTALIGAWFSEQKYYGAGYHLEEAVTGKDLMIDEAKRWLDEYFMGHIPTMGQLVLAPKVTDFRKKVCEVLITIPYGETMTYQAIVDKLRLLYGGDIGSARAVGGAVGHNPISIIMPCHRVIGSNGSLTGYAGGVNRKVELLKIEGTQI